MKKNRIASIVFATVILILTLAVSADTGYDTATDPLVSLSYVNNVLKPQIVKEVLEELKGTYPAVGAQTTYTVVTMKKGQKLMANDCTEVIMTYGSAYAVVTSETDKYAGVGLNDLTEGKRLLDGDLLICDHYTIIPKGDGRGLAVTSDTAYFLVRGDYNVK